MGIKLEKLTDKQLKDLNSKRYDRWINAYSKEEHCQRLLDETKAETVKRLIKKLTKRSKNE